MPSVRAGVRRIRYKKETDKLVKYFSATLKNESICAKNVIFELPAKQKYDSGMRERKLLDHYGISKIPCPAKKYSACQ